MSSSPYSLPLVRVLGGLSVLLLVGCGGDDGDDPEGDAGTDSTLPDVVAPDGGDTGTDTDLPPPPPPPGEDVTIVFTREATSLSTSLPQYVQVMVTDQDCRISSPDVCDRGSCAPVEIAPPSESDRLCQNGCLFTPALDWIVYFDAAQSRTMRKIALGANRQVSGASAVIAADVTEVSVGADGVAYRVGDTIFHHRLSTGDTVEVATLGGGGAPYLSPDGRTIIVREVTSLTSMTLRRFDVASGQISPLYTLNDGGPQGAAGSLVRGSEPLAMSPDGARLAMLTTVREDSNSCNSNADCGAPNPAGYQCPVGVAGGRCYRHQQSIRILNTQASELLGQACSADVDCGADHLCDLSAPDSSGLGLCIPGRIVLGPAGPQSCSQLRIGEYNGARPQLSWRSNRDVMALLTNNCTGQNIDATDLVAVNLDTRSLQRVLENPGLAHGGAACFNATERCYETSQCVVAFDQVALSPEGTTAVLVGNSLTSANPQNNQLWIADSFGRTPRVAMTRSIDYRVRSVSVHPR